MSSIFAQIVRAAPRAAHSLRPTCDRALIRRPLGVGLVVAPQAPMTTSLKRILVATDVSDGSDGAISQAIELGKQTGASLEIVYVRELGEVPFAKKAA